MLVNSLGSYYVIILVTTSSRVEAEKIAQSLLEEKLVACVNILGPVSSHFNWAGKLEHAEEFLMLLKSRQNLFEEVAKRVRELHCYDTPEIVALPIVAGAQNYLDWLNRSLK